MFIHEVIHLNMDYFYLNGMFVLYMYLKTFCLRKFKGRNQNFEK